MVAASRAVSLVMFVLLGMCFSDGNNSKGNKKISGGKNVKSVAFKSEIRNKRRVHSARITFDGRGNGEQIDRVTLMSAKKGDDNPDHFQTVRDYTPGENGIVVNGSSNSVTLDLPSEICKKSDNVYTIQITKSTNGSNASDVYTQSFVYDQDEGKFVLLYDDDRSFFVRYLWAFIILGVVVIAVILLIVFLYRGRSES